MTNTPYRARTIIAHQQRTIRRSRYTNRSSPDAFVVHDEPGKEVLILSARMTSLVQRHANDLVTGARRSVPGSMLGCEDVSFILRRELVAVVEGHLQRCIVRLQYDIRSDDLVLQVRPFPHQPRILMTAHVPPRPSVESPRLHMRNVVRNQVVAQAISLVDRAPKLTGLRVDRKPNWIANSRREDTEARTIGVVFKNVCAIFFARSRV